MHLAFFRQGNRGTDKLYGFLNVSHLEHHFNQAPVYVAQLVFQTGWYPVLVFIFIRLSWMYSALRSARVVPLSSPEASCSTSVSHYSCLPEKPMLYYCIQPSCFYCGINMLNQLLLTLCNACDNSTENRLLAEQMV